VRLWVGDLATWWVGGLVGWWVLLLRWTNVMSSVAAALLWSICADLAQQKPTRAAKKKLTFFKSRLSPLRVQFFFC
jgi:hypothetical protein